MKDQYEAVSKMWVVRDANNVKAVRFRCGHERIYSSTDFKRVDCSICEECLRQREALLDPR